ALVVPGSPMFTRHGVRVAALALERRWPTMASLGAQVRDGLLVGYGWPNLASLFRRAAVLVDKILKGVSPAELPVEQPREFDFVINLKTAQTLGLTIPQHVLLQ